MSLTPPLAGRPVVVVRYEDVHRSTRRGEGVHDYAVIVLVTEGTSKVKHGTELTLTAGDVHLIPPGDSHGGHGERDAKGWVLALLPEAFPGESLQWEMPSALQRVRGGCHPVLRPKAFQLTRIQGWMAQLHAELEEDLPGRDEATAALVRLILLELDRALGNAAARSTPGLVQKALTHIEKHCLEPLSLVDVARAVGVSPSRVASAMRAETGRSAGEWILASRMAEARRRLRATKEPVETLATQVGYRDVTHFIRQFRKVHGCTPSAWRKSSKRARRDSNPRPSA